MYIYIYVYIKIREKSSLSWWSIFKKKKCSPPKTPWLASYLQCPAKTETLSNLSSIWKKHQYCNVVPRGNNESDPHISWEMQQWHLWHHNRLIYIGMYYFERRVIKLRRGLILSQLSTSHLQTGKTTYCLETSGKWILHDTKSLKLRFDNWSNFWCPHKLGEIMLQSPHHIILFFRGISIWQKTRQTQFLWVPSVKLASAHCCLLLRNRSLSNFHQFFLQTVALSM